MTHRDPETLALIALGEPMSEEHRLHLAECADCRAEVERFARPVAAARSAEPVLEQPRPAVWAGIAEELGLGVTPIRPVPALPATRGRRVPRRVVVALLAAAAVTVIGGIGVGWWALGDRPQQLASATLKAFPDWPGSSGTAVVDRLQNGRVVLKVTTNVPLTGTTDHEVWLMTDGAKRLVSVGLLKGSSGTFAVPANVDLDRYRLVDVSAEPRDSDPAHSGDSIVRGALHS